MNKLAVTFSILVAAGLSTHAAAKQQPSQLVPDFLRAVELVSAGQDARGVFEPGVQLWVDGLRERGIDPRFLQRRLAKARTRAVDPFAAFRTIDVEALPASNADKRAGAFPVALHAFRLDVIEDFDDVYDDDVYAYFITTHDDLVWGKVTGIYGGLDEGDSVFFSAGDRGLFGPTGEKLTPKNHTLVDFGLIESDGDDIAQLQQMSDAIVDLALIALTVYNPQAGAAAAQARAEVNNLLHLVIAMDADDRLVTDTLRFTPDEMESALSAGTVSEFSRDYERETTFSHFDWRLHFRLLR